MTPAKTRFLKPVRSLFQRLLPENFPQQTALIQQYQQFFLNQKSDALFQVVKVLNVTDDYLHVCVPNPTLAAYFRLHSEQLREQIQQQFGRDLQIKLSVRPDVEVETEHSSLKQPQHYSAAVCEQIKQSADVVEDEELRDALKSLSRTLQQKDQ